MRNFYIYRHIRLDKNEPFYIGIGTRRKIGFNRSLYDRAYSKKGRSTFWSSILRKTDYRVEIMIDDMSKEEAIEKEKEFISLYGRSNIGKGILCNLTDGGEGVFGYVPTMEKRIKHGELLKQMYRDSEYRKKHISIQQVAKKKRTGIHHYMYGLSTCDIKISKPIINVETKEIFYSDVLSKKLNISTPTLLSWLNGNAKNPSKYCYLSDYNNGKYVINQKLTPNNKKKVINTETNIVYNSAKEASMASGINYTYFCRMLIGERKNKTNFKYIEL